MSKLIKLPGVSNFFPYYALADEEQIFRQIDSFTLAACSLD